ncbi:MAG: hypothetical protein VX768_09015 [Planctomycetota bacterium]|nr:hypothetical protein [Planctomycetota bacterium]
MKGKPNLLKSIAILFLAICTAQQLVAQKQDRLVVEGESDDKDSSIKTGLSPEKPKTGLQKKCAYLKPRLESVLRFHFKQKEHAEKRSPWGIMHAMVAFGPYAEMYGDGKLVRDVDWLCNNRKCRGWQLLKLEDGKLATINGPGRQGHDGQLLAILAQSQVPGNRTLKVEGKMWTVNDLVDYEKETCRSGTELTFKLIGLAHYLDSDEKWKSNDGQQWSLERLVQEELRQPVNGSACGGTHRLMGYSYSLLMRKLQEKEMSGHWKRADEFVSDFRKYALSMQNRDGSFSTDWFKRREARRDSQRRVQTTGHILEWLVFSATHEELSDSRLIRAVDYLSSLMWSQRNTRWEVGPKGHAVRSLRLFYERVFADTPAKVAMNPSDLGDDETTR